MQAQDERGGQPKKTGQGKTPTEDREAQDTNRREESPRHLGHDDAHDADKQTEDKAHDHLIGGHALSDLSQHCRTHTHESESRCSPGAYTLERERKSTRERARARERENGGAGSSRSVRQEEEGGEMGREEEGWTSVCAADALVHLADVLVGGFHLLTLGLEDDIAFQTDFLRRCHQLH